MDKRQIKEQRKVLALKELMKRDGYTEKNLYTRENRIPIKVTKTFFQHISRGTRWIEAKGEIIIYVTKTYTEKIPDNIVLAIRANGERYICEKEEDVLGGPEKYLLHSNGPMFSKRYIPHILWTSEIKEGLKYLYK
jgi:hypothetical protein